MSKLFFDHFIEIENISIHISGISESMEEKVDLWNLIDEYINNRIIYLILNELEDEHHDGFLEMFLDKPFDENIIGFLDERLPRSFESLITENLPLITSDLIEILEIQSPPSEKVEKKKKSVSKK